MSNSTDNTSGNDGACVWRQLDARRSHSILPVLRVALFVPLFINNGLFLRYMISRLSFSSEHLRWIIMRPFWISSPQSFFVHACNRGWRIPIMVCSTEAIANMEAGEGEAKSALEPRCHRKTVIFTSAEPWLGVSC